MSAPQESPSIFVLPEHTLVEERFRDLLELSTDWFWEMDAELSFSHFSSGIENSGITSGAFIGKCRWDLPSELTPEQWAAHRKQLEAHQPFRDFEYNIIVAGQVRWFSINGIPLHDHGGRFVGYRGNARDITERKQMDQELRRHRDHLDELVKSQTRHLVHANQVKSEFLANMSHELRTPMHAILSFARIGHAKVNAVPAEKLASYFEHIRSSGERLLELVNDLLDLAKLDAGKMQYAMVGVDLRGRIKDAVAALAPLLEAKNLHCRIVENVADGHVIGDQKRLDQVLHNLLGNAIQFTPPGRTIEVGLADDRMPSGRRTNDAGELPALRLTVADEGVGIPAEEVEVIFDKFTQSSRTRSGAGGTGLGLTICREIITAHRGIIRARNRRDGGAAFDVLLPVLEEGSS